MQLMTENIPSKPSLLMLMVPSEMYQLVLLHVMTSETSSFLVDNVPTNYPGERAPYSTGAVSNVYARQW